MTILPDIEHWLATIDGAGYVAVPRTTEDADDYRAQGWAVKGPFVPASQLEGAVGAAAAVIEAWDTWMGDMRSDEDDQASFHMLRDAIDHLRGGR